MRPPSRDHQPLHPSLHRRTGRVRHDQVPVPTPVQRAVRFARAASSLRRQPAEVGPGTPSGCSESQLRGTMQPHELPPPVRMIELLGGFRISQALYAAAVLGVADQLVAGPAATEALAARARAPSPSLYRLLRTLAGAGVFTEPEPGVFAMTPRSGRR